MPKSETFNRLEVLQSATETFHNKGYNGTSMQDLVDATDLNRSSIYNSFGSKLGIFMEVLSYYEKGTSKTYSKKIANTYNAIDAIKGIFDAVLLEIIEDKHHNGCLLINSKSEMANQDHTIRSFIEKNQDKMLAMLEDIVTKGQMERIFNEKLTATQYALYLYITIQGLQVIGILNKNEEDLMNVINTAIDVLT